VISSKFRYFPPRWAGRSWYRPGNGGGFPDVSVECTRLGRGRRRISGQAAADSANGRSQGAAEKLQRSVRRAGRGIVWEGEQTERLKVEEGPNLVEGFLDAVESA
jgi:hypothetical protein